MAARVLVRGQPWIAGAVGLMALAAPELASDLARREGASPATPQASRRRWAWRRTAWRWHQMAKRLLATVYAEDRIGVWDTASAREVNSIAVASRTLDYICSVHPYMTGKVMVSAR